MQVTEFVVTVVVTLVGGLIVNQYTPGLTRILASSKRVVLEGQIRMWEEAAAAPHKLTLVAVQRAATLVVFGISGAIIVGLAAITDRMDSSGVPDHIALFGFDGSVTEALLLLAAASHGYALFVFVSLRLFLLRASDPEQQATKARRRLALINAPGAGPT